jgi:hypothetical protein
MSIKSFETHDSLTRCVLCDAPVGDQKIHPPKPTNEICQTKTSSESRPTFYLLGEPYCEYCGLNICPFCGISKDKPGCEATDVNFHEMHFDEIEE